MRSFSFFPGEKALDQPFRMNLSAVALDKPTELFAGVFTRNEFPGVPVIIGRKMLKRKLCRGIVCNNKIANVCAPGGIEHAQSILQKFSEVNGGTAEDYFAASTGIIGWELPVNEMCAEISALTSEMQSESILPFAEAIMTTDNFVKVRSANAGHSLIVGTAKGAGMIEPNMATMLSFILTDAAVSRNYLRKILPSIADETFNRISIDSDQSTSDMLLCVSSGLKKVKSDEFEEKLYYICKQLAEDIVRNGEGTAHVIKLTVSGAPDNASAVTAGKNIINSPLVKTAIYGNDPNVGRIIMSIGDWAGNNGIKLESDKVKISLGPDLVFHNGVFNLNKQKEKELSAYLAERMLKPEPLAYPEHDLTVDIEIDLGIGQGKTEIIGSDLSYEYVRENAEYTS